MITGIEFGPDSCVLVRARRRGDTLELSAAHVIEQAEWPSQDAAAAELLTRIRRDKAFPRPARVVAWGLAEGAAPRDPATRAALRPLIAAGFRIDSVLSPSQALAILAGTRPRPGIAAWLAVNRHGAAIAIVRGTSLLYARAFGWNWEGAAIGSQAQLLQRYSIVAHLAPEVRRGVELVKTRYGVAVDSIITCGDLPDLRSLTMPLIEELDLEVETLDSADGLEIPPTARRDHLPESLSAVRLACAAAEGPPMRGAQIDLVRLARAAAFVVAAGGLGWIGYVWWMRPQPAPIAASSVARTPTTQAARASTDTSRPDQAGSASDAGSTAVAPSTGTGVPRPAPGRDPADRASARTPAQPRSPVPAPNAAVRAAGRPDSRAEPPSATRPANTGRPPAAPSGPPPAPARGVSAPARPQRPPEAAAQLPGASAEPRIAPAPADASPALRAGRPAPLKDPLPVIDTILVSSDRRLAVIDGAFVGPGDSVGPRTVVRIEVDAVYLREPSGLEIRVPIRMRRDL